MKYLYIINCWFQDSEFGGLLNVIASGDRECCKILEKYWPNHEDNHRIFEEVQKAQKFALANSHEESRIVADIVT